MFKVSLDFFTVKNLEEMNEWRRALRRGQGEKIIIFCAKNGSQSLMDFSFLVKPYDYGIITTFD